MKERVARLQADKRYTSISKGAEEVQESKQNHTVDYFRWSLDENGIEVGLLAKIDIVFIPLLTCSGCSCHQSRHVFDRECSADSAEGD